MKVVAALTVFCCGMLLSLCSNGQGNFTGINGSVVEMPCYQNCMNLNLQVPHLKSDEHYTVIPLTYRPYPYTTNSLNELTNLYDDDKFSAVIPLPFSISFYGAVYNQVVVGSNGLVTFDVANANCNAAYSIANTIPYAGGTICVQSGVYYPRASVMGIFSDIDASAAASPSDRKIEWRMEGTAPFRRFVASFYHVGMYGVSPNASCNRLSPTTFQIVINESIAAIDVYIENKQCADNSNGGRAILGAQNWDRDQAVAATGKNATAWTAEREAYRFLPSGATSRFVRAEIYAYDGTTLLSTATPGFTASPTTVDLDFGNICVTGTSQQFIARTTYTSAIDATQFIVLNDTFTIRKSQMTATYTTTPASCAGASDGTITMNLANGGGPYNYSVDGGTPVSNPSATFTFTNLPAGAHTIRATGAFTCDSDPIIVNITDGPPLTTTASVSNVLCNAGTTGSITVTQPTAGAPPYTYSLDGINWQTSNIFNGLAAGDYIVYYRSGNGCAGQLNRTVTEPPVLSATASSSAVICNGESNGKISVAVPTGGTAPYEYSIDGVNWQASNEFTVAANTYNVIVRDANGCTVTNSVTVTQPTALSATATTTNATCNGGNDGTITVTANGGNSNYQFATDAASFQNSNVFNVGPGTYTITVKDNLGCTYTLPGVVVGLTNDLTYTAPGTPTICEGASAQLSITSNATGYTWSPATGLSNAGIANPVASPTATTNYTVTLTYGRCTADITATVNVNAAPVPDAGAQGFICYGQSYTLQASGGIDYRWTPSTYLDNPNSANPVATPDRTTTYSLSILRDANGCPSLVTDDVIVDVTPPIKVTTFPFDTIAYAGDQFRILATSAATNYLWTPSVGLSADNIADPIVTAGAVGDVVVYKVTASTSAGCKGEGFVRVQVYKGPDIYVASGFTPNNDGLNDKFFPLPVGIREIKYFRVFNRSGQLMFETRKLNDGWDGKVAGKDQPNGVYVWMAEGITRDGKVITKKGTVTLIR